MKQSNKCKVKKGFTLVELIVVIGTLVALSVIAIVTYTNIRVNARISGIKASATALAQAMNNYEGAGGATLNGGGDASTSIMIVPGNPSTGQLSMDFSVKVPIDHAPYMEDVIKRNNADNLWEASGNFVLK